MTRPKNPSRDYRALLEECLPHVPAELAERIRDRITPTRQPKAPRKPPAEGGPLVLTGRAREDLRRRVADLRRDGLSQRAIAEAIEVDGRHPSTGLVHKMISESIVLGELKEEQ